MRLRLLWGVALLAIGCAGYVYHRPFDNEEADHSPPTQTVAETPAPGSASSDGFRRAAKPVITVMRTPRVPRAAAAPEHGEDDRVTTMCLSTFINGSTDLVNALVRPGCTGSNPNKLAWLTYRGGLLASRYSSLSQMRAVLDATLALRPDGRTVVGNLDEDWSRRYYDSFSEADHEKVEMAESDAANDCVDVGAAAAIFQLGRECGSDSMALSSDLYIASYQKTCEKIAEEHPSIDASTCLARAEEAYKGFFVFILKLQHREDILSRMTGTQSPGSAASTGQ